MTREQVTKLLIFIDRNYRGFESLDKMPKKKATDTIDAWAATLANVDAKDAVEAVNEHIARGEKYPPSTADIFARLNTAQGADAWLTFKKALRNSSYNAESEYNKLPPEIQRITSPAEMRRLAKSPMNEAVEFEKFKKAYVGGNALRITG